MADGVRQAGCAVLLFLLAACSGPSRQETQPVVVANDDAANALEALAADSGVIGEEETADPRGSYGGAYAGGEDRLCMLSAGRKDGAYGFGVELRIGQEEYCRGRGDAKRAGDLLILRFARGGCTIMARYEGDRIVMPGVVDSGCQSLCSARGSFAGVSLPRVGMDDAAARHITRNDGEPLCGR